MSMPSNFFITFIFKINMSVINAHGTPIIKQPMNEYIK